MCSHVAYIRVSKLQQGPSGPGLEAQQAAIRVFCSHTRLRRIPSGRNRKALTRWSGA